MVKRLKLADRFTCIALVAMMLLPGVVAAQTALPVFVSILPQKYFVQQIGKDRVQVGVMVQPGASPATYEPKPSQMAALSRAALYFSIGVPFERTWLEKIGAANPGMKIIHTDHGIQKIPMAAHHHHKEEDSAHGHGGHDAEHKDHDEAVHEDHHDADNGLDPHIWMAPQLVSIQARTVLNALVQADPKNRAVYEKNFQAFAADIDALDRELHQLFRDKKGLQFMVFHPAWGYFAHAYGLEQVAIEIEGKDPKPAQLKELIHHARESRIRVIFVQPQFSTKSAKLVAAEIGGRVIPANPLALDWLANMRAMAAQFKEALR